MKMMHSGQSTALHIVRLSLGLVFLFAGISKAFMIPDGFAAGVKNIESIAFMHDFVVTTLPWAEIILGALLILGLWTRLMALISTLLLLAITITSGFFAMPGAIILPTHTFGLMVSLGLLFGGKQECCTIDGIMKKSKKVEKIKA